MQTLTEFFPISSSAHLSVINKLFHIQKSSPGLNAALHLGTLIPIIVYFRHFFFKDMFKDKWIPHLIVATLPAVIVGFIIKKTIGLYDSSALIAMGGLIGTLLLLVADKKPEEQSAIKLKDAFIIGLFQTLAFLPGMSRMGMCLTGSRFLKIDRFTATQFAFILSVPVTSGAILLTIKDAFADIDCFTFIGLVIFEAVFGYFILTYMMNFIKKHNYKFFIYYRFVFFALFGVINLINYIFNI